MYHRSHDEGWSASRKGVCIHGGGSASGGGVVLNRGGVCIQGVYIGRGVGQTPLEIHGILRIDT